MNNVIRDLPNTLLKPPAATDEKNRDWFSIPVSDQVTEHITAILWNQEIPPENWQAARLSAAAYIYREKTTNWKVVAKFYTSKTGNDVVRHSENEFQATQRAWEYLDSDQYFRSVQPLGVWGGVLFLEFLNGLTLEDKIAIRQSQPGELISSLNNAGKLLSRLHNVNNQKRSTSDFGLAADYSYKLIDNLAKHGVLQGQPDVQCGLIRLIEKWANSRLMWDFLPTLNHGDATTTNLILPPEGGAVAIDWERSEFADPAADLGRLMAEVAHSVNQFGGDFSEGVFFAAALAAAYCKEVNSKTNLDNLMRRSRFYQAASTLRIARNGWLHQKDRLALVLQAFSLLSRDINT